MNAAQAERALIFAWEHVRRVPLVLPGFILLAFAGHVGAFFLFRIVYPPQASMPMPPPEITLLDPSRPDHQALLRWAEAEDTAPAAAQTGITDRLLEISYRPSYTTVRTPPLTLPSEPGRVQYPPARDPLALIRSVETKPAPPPALAAPAPTQVTFSTELAARTRGPIVFAPRTRAAEPLEPTQFLVGVSDRGEVRFTILQRSSGNPRLDAEAAAQLARVQLEPAPEPITWTRATIQWSADAYAPPVR